MMRTTVVELAKALEKGLPVFDVRTPAEYAMGHVPGALNLPLQELNQRAMEIPRDQQVFVICQSGSRSMAAVEALNAHGWNCLSVDGGTGYWARAGYELA